MCVFNTYFSLFLISYVTFRLKYVLLSFFVLSLHGHETSWFFIVLDMQYRRISSAAIGREATHLSVLTAWAANNIIRFLHYYGVIFIACGVVC